MQRILSKNPISLWIFCALKESSPFNIISISISFITILENTTDHLREEKLVSAHNMRRFRPSAEKAWSEECTADDIRVFCQKEERE